MDVDELPRGPRSVRPRHPLVLLPIDLMEPFVNKIAVLLRAARRERYHQHPLESDSLVPVNVTELFQQKNTSVERAYY